MRHPKALSPDTSILVLVDLQETLLASVHGGSQVLRNAKLLLESALLMNVPVIASLQSLEKLGPLSPELFDPHEPSPAVFINKMEFSAWENADFRRTIKSFRGNNRLHAVLAGVETHICVAQTARDLSVNSFMVHTAADACSSHTVELHKLGIDYIRDCGAAISSSESVVYEWLKSAESPAFRSVLGLVKQARTTE